MEDEKAWLRRRYRDAPLEGCYEKRVNFADVSEELEKQSAPAKFTSNTVSHAIKEVFPQVLQQTIGKIKANVYFWNQTREL